MKKILFTAGTVAVLALASCSNDETSQEALVNPNEIRYEVVTNNSTRANTLFNATTGLTQDFKIYAKFQHSSASNPDKNYINGDNVTYTSGSWSYSKHYWPEGILDFFAWSGTNGTTSAALDCNTTDNSHSLKVSGVVIPESHASQNDMLYAVTPSQAKPTGDQANDPIKLNFRHALAQLVFKAKNVSPNIFVKIDKISLVNIDTKGNVAYSATTTNPQYKESDATDANAVISCSWTRDANQIVAGTSDADAGTHPQEVVSVGAQIPVIYNADPVTICESSASSAAQTAYDEAVAAEATAKAAAEADPDDQDAQDAYAAAQEATTKAKDALDADAAAAQTLAQAMYVIPQEFTPWDAAAKTKASEITGTYFKVKCIIYNLADGENSGYKATTDDLVLYSDAADDTVTKDILIPIKALQGGWLAGRKYIYTFIFGAAADDPTDPGNGGLDPEEPDPDNPVLKYITYDLKNLSVDDWVEANATDQNMNYKKPTTEGQNN